MSSSLEERLAAYRLAHPAHRVTTPAGTFEHTASGTGSRAVVILHGGGSVAEAAHPFALALEPDLRVIAIDWPASVRTVDDVVTGIAAVLDRERLDRVSLLGFSMGGMIAQSFASRHPERVDKLVLYVSMGPSSRYAARFRRYRAILSVVPDAWLRAASKRAVRRWMERETAIDRSEDVAFLAAYRVSLLDRRLVDKRSLLSDASVLVDFFSRPLAPKWPRPRDVLIVEAEHDRMVDDAERQRLRESYPGATLHTIADASHYAGVLAPEAITSVIRAFLGCERARP